MEINQSTNKAMLRLFAVLLLALLSAAVIFSNTVRSAPLAADLSSSSKTASSSTVSISGTVKYTLIVNNSGDADANGILITDTLPTGVTYVNSSYAAVPSANVFTTSHSAATSSIQWGGNIGSGNQIAVSFDVMVGGTITNGDRITNAFQINYGGSIITKTVVITATGESPTKTVYLPAVFKGLVAPTLSSNLPSASGGNFAWTTSWNNNTGATSYVIQESNDPNFGSSTEFTTSSANYLFTRAAARENVFYYRVRGENSLGISPWSNVVKVIGAYHNDFNSADPKWQIRRQDLDDTNNAILFPGLSLKLDIDGRWDYALISPLVEAPPPPYRIETRVKYEGVGNLNTYGMIWGGEWNGQECPRSSRSVGSVPEDMIPAWSDVHDIISGNNRAVQGFVDNCFETYYRAMFLWAGPSNVLRTQIKSIFQHNNNNHGQGIDLVSWREFGVSSGDNLAYNVWKIDVYPDGTMHLRSGDNIVATFTDHAFINQPYFGFFASTDEYPGADPLYDYVTVSPLP